MREISFQLIFGSAVLQPLLYWDGPSTQTQNHLPCNSGRFYQPTPPTIWSLSNKTNTHYCQYYNVILGQWDFNQTLQRSAHEGIKLHVPIWLLIAGNYTSRSFLAKKTRVKVNLWNSLLSWRLYMIASMGYTIFRLSFILSYSSMSSGMHIK